MASEFTHNAIFDSLVEALEDSWAEKNVKEVCGLLRKQQGKIRRKYEDVKNDAKKKYMKKSKGLLDRHKCAAAFMFAFLSEMSVSDTSKMGRGLVREKLAIIAGLTVLAVFVMADDSTEDNKRFAKYLKDNKGFNFPQNMYDDNPYSINWATELYLARTEDKIFLPSLAHELFYIECYNRIYCALGQKKMKNMGL